MTDYDLKFVNGKMVGKLLKVGIDTSNKRGAVCLYIGISYLFALNMISETSYSRILFVLTPLIQNRKKNAVSGLYNKLWKEDGFREWVILLLFRDYEERGISFKSRKHFKDFLFSVTFLTIPAVNGLLLGNRVPLGKENENSFIKFYGNKVYFLKPTFHAYDFIEMESSGEENIIARGISNLNFDLNTLKVSIEYGEELKECYGIYDLEKGSRKVVNVLNAYPYREEESVWRRLLFELISCADMYWYISYLKKDGKISLLDDEPELAARRRMQIINYVMEPQTLSLIEIEKKINQVLLFDKYNEVAIFALKEFLCLVKPMGYKEEEDLSKLFDALFRYRDVLFGKYNNIPVLSVRFMKIFLSDIKNRTDIKNVIERGGLVFDNFENSTDNIEEKYAMKKYVGWFEYGEDGRFLYERYLIERGIVEWEYTIAPTNKDNYSSGKVKFNRNTGLFLVECEKISPELLKEVIEVFGMQTEEDICIKDQDGERIISSEDYLDEKNNPTFSAKEELPFN